MKRNTTLKDTHNDKMKSGNQVSFQMFYAMIEVYRDATITHN